MSGILNHRVTITFEKLKTLRKELFQAYSKNAKFVYRPTKSKNSQFYTDLGERLEISEGTLLKFFTDDNNRNYWLSTIETIEGYIHIHLSIDNSLIDIDKSDSILQINIEKDVHALKIFATKIYIELTTRKAGIPIDENNDVIEEIYNSWYKLFCIIRDEMKSLPANCLKDMSNPKSIIGLANNILNEVLRPHLTKHHAKYRKWLENAKQDLKNKNHTPQELQKIYPNYDILIKSINQINTILNEDAKSIISFINFK